MATPISIIAPDKYHSAYNPIFFEVRNFDVTFEDKYYKLNLNISNSGKTETVSLTRPFISKKAEDSGMPGSGIPGAPSAPEDFPKAIFNVSGVIRNYFSIESPSMKNSVEVDNRLFVKYSCGGQTYIAINGIEELPISGTALSMGYKILSSMSTLRRYKGYDLDISLLCGADAVSPFTPNSVNRVKPEALPINYLQDNEGNFIQDESGNYIILDAIDIIDTPVPRNPFYIRWINRLGGIDYYMFSNSQEVTIAVKGSQSLLNHHTGNSNTYNIDLEATIAIGASGISKKEWDILSLLPTSPLIEWYNEKSCKWTTITIGKSENKLNTNRSLHDIEFIFNLPTYQTQFA